MARVPAAILATAIALLATASPAAADSVTPRGAAEFRNSIGVSTHIVYFDTAYGDWSRVVRKLQELGVSHVRDGVYANPTPHWHDWNERYFDAVELAAARGIRFNFGVPPPGTELGTLDEVLGVVGGRLRHAAEAVEAPDEFDKYVGGARWPARLSNYGHQLYRKVKASRSIRTLPVIGPSFASPAGPRLVGSQRSWVDVGNIHPYTGGLSPGASLLRPALASVSAAAGRKPVWATEAGFHNALRERVPGQQPPVSEAAGAVYTLRTVLEHFRSGIRRTYLYELIDEKPERGLKDPEQHFGLLRRDFSPKPAFTALKNLLTLVGSDGRRTARRPLRLGLAGNDSDVRRLVLQKANGDYLVVLWRGASVWDRDRRRPIAVGQRRIELRLPGAARVASAAPLHSARLHRLRLSRGRVRIGVGAGPVVVQVTPRHARH